ncbi:MAG: helix-turn-helix domain-containing protein [Candidatus ainarchaeum sp.]|nr:helix-turn-helix domain-containing protein [Candidatus ainarchaeum sp.]
METKILSEIGLTQGEIKVYLGLLRTGSTSTGPLAKESGVSRSKLYIIVDKLEKKGFASHFEKNGVKYFQAVEPEKINDYLSQKEEDLKKLGRDFNAFLPKLNEFYGKTKEQQNVAIYQGIKGLKVAHEHVYLKVGKGEEYLYLGIPAYQPSEHHRYWQKDHLRRAKVGIKTRMLFNRDADIKTLKNRMSYGLADARYMPTDVITPAYFLIYKDTVMVGIASSQPIAIEIISPEIADSFRSYFEAFWKESKKIRK